MIRLLCVGKNKDKSLEALDKEYIKRLSAFDKVVVEEVKDEPTPNDDRPAEQEKAKEAEGKRILARIKDNEYVFLLDLHGNMPDSIAFSKQLVKAREKGPLVFVIAGSMGPSPELRNRADALLKLSDLTFPHLLCRVLILEQIYRAFMIDAGRTYHK